MDRLAAFFHWDDPEGLDQALLVARRHEVDLDRIEAWSRAEGRHPKFVAFRDRLIRGS